MKWKKPPFTRYALLEITFFITVFFLFPVFTDIEYILNEAPCDGCQEPFYVQFLYRLVSGFFIIWPWLFFYQYILKGLLLKKKYRWFFISVVAYLLLLELYTVQVYYRIVSQLSFLPAFITQSFSRYLNSKPVLHFSVVYVTVQMLVFTALAYFIHNARHEKLVADLKREKLQADLNYLKAQIQPHFFFNTLNNIYSLALRQSKDTAPLIERLSDMMRYILYESDKPKVPLRQELDFLKNYVSVQAVRFSDRIHIRFDSQLSNPDILIEPLLLLPFIENAFKHGVEEETADGLVDVIMVEMDRELTVLVKNTKPPHPSKPEQQGGIGLANAGRRLALLYEGRHQLKLSETENTYSITLTLHLA